MAKKLTSVSRVWSKQPDYVAGIDWSNTLTLGLRAAVVSSLGNTNIVTGRALEVDGPLPLTTSDIFGRAYKYSASQTLRTEEVTVTGAFTTIALAIPGRTDNQAVIGTAGTNAWTLWCSISGKIQIYDGVGYIDSGISVVPGKPYAMGVSVSGTTVTLCINGQVSVHTAAASPSYTSKQNIGSRNGAGDYAFLGDIAGFLFFNRALNAKQLADLTANPWQIFEPEQIPLFKPEGTGPVTHPTSGNVVGNTATITGAALRETGAQTHPSTGDVVGNTANVTGTALRYRAHATAGTVTGLTSNVTGTALRYRLHTTTGAVTGLTSTVIGSATNEPAAGVHEVDGVVTGTTGAVTGSALHIGVHRTTGVVAGYQGAVTGTAKNYTVHETTGVLSGFSAEVVGAAQRSGAVIVHSTSGVLAGYDSAVTGAATNMGGMTLTPADIQAIVAAIKAEIMPVNIVRVNNIDVDGTGADSDPWGPV
jgi:hypothetical protein